MGQGREAARLVALHPSSRITTAHTQTVTPGLADGQDLHPLQFQFGALLGCLRRLQTTRNREEFSRAGGDWTRAVAVSNVQSSSVSLLSLMRN